MMHVNGNVYMSGCGEYVQQNEKKRKKSFWPISACGRIDLNN